MTTNKWITYQKERFPLVPYCGMALMFSFSGLCLSSMMRGHTTLPDWRQIVVAFITSLLLFAQLRIADEFKDYNDDCKYQPYRPVPRGLISLKELGIVGLCAGVIQLALTMALSIKLLPLLIATWIYLGLMSAEFFVRDRLRQSPLAYLLTHMPILLLLDTYITGCDWILAGSGMPPHLVLFLGVSFLNGMIVELGRKFRAPLDEEEGVETYTKVWGINRATAAWLAVMTLAAVASTSVAIVTARGLGACLFNCIATATMLALSTSMAIQFCKRPTTGTAKRLQALSSVWVMTTYLSLGTLPAIARSISTCMH